MRDFVNVTSARAAMAQEGYGIDLTTSDGDCMFLSLSSLAALLFPQQQRRPTADQHRQDPGGRRFSSVFGEELAQRHTHRAVTRPYDQTDGGAGSRRGALERIDTEVARGHLQPSRFSPKPQYDRSPESCLPPLSSIVGPSSTYLSSLSTAPNARQPAPGEYHRTSTPGGLASPPPSPFSSISSTSDPPPSYSFPSRKTPPPQGPEETSTREGARSNARAPGYSGWKGVPGAPPSTLTTLPANNVLEFVWAPRIGRCVAPDSALARSEKTVTVSIPPGHWVHVYDGTSEVYPWTSNGNTWIKGQVRGKQGCVCGFSFTKGGVKDVFKRPSVIREHIARCHRLPKDDPLAKICRYTRQADKDFRRRSHNDLAAPVQT